MYARMQERLLRIPGVVNAAFSLYAPMSGDNWSDRIVSRAVIRPKRPSRHGTVSARATSTRSGRRCCAAGPSTSATAPGRRSSPS